MAEQWFLKLDGIAGESTADGHAGEIDVLSWSWGVHHTGATAVGSGAAGSKTDFDDFHLVARIGVASPQLFLACATGKHVKTAELTGARVTGKGKATAFLTYTMSDVLVTAIEHGDADSGPPIEQFALAYAKIEMTYVPQKRSGKLGTPAHAGFDVKQNKAV